MLLNNSQRGCFEAKIGGTFHCLECVNSGEEAGKQFPLSLVGETSQRVLNQFCSLIKVVSKVVEGYF